MQSSKIQTARSGWHMCLLNAEWLNSNKWARIGNGATAEFTDTGTKKNLKKKKKQHEKHRQWTPFYFFFLQFHFSSLHGWKTNNSTSNSGPQTSCKFPLRIMRSHSHFLFFSESFRNCYFISFIRVSNLSLHEWSQVTVVLILSYFRINLASNIGWKKLDFFYLHRSINIRINKYSEIYSK